MNDVRSCYRCGHETPQALERCPQCGYPLLTAQAIYSRGWLLLVLGVVLAGGIAVLTVLIVQHLDDFTGGPAMLVFTFSVLYVVFGFGVVALVSGVYQIVYRRRHHNLVRVLLWMATLFFALGLLAQLLELF